MNGMLPRPCFAYRINFLAGLPLQGTGNGPSVWILLSLFDVFDYYLVGIGRSESPPPAAEESISLAPQPLAPPKTRVAVALDFGAAKMSAPLFGPVIRFGCSGVPIVHAIRTGADRGGSVP